MRDPARVGSALGRAYLVNTGGTTLGALAASFVLVPGLGVRGTLDALALLVAPGARPRHAAGRPALARGLAAAAAPRRAPSASGRRGTPATCTRTWPRSRTRSSISDNRGLLRQGVEGIVVKEVQDGVDVTASVAFYVDMLALLVNGKIDATDGMDMAMQRLLGHVPMLLRPSARTSS